MCVCVCVCVCAHMLCAPLPEYKGQRRLSLWIRNLREEEKNSFQLVRGGREGEGREERRGRGGRGGGGGEGGREGKGTLPGETA